MAAHGLPGWRYLTTTDQHERLVLRALCNAAEEVRQRLNHNLAVAIVNAYAKAQKR